MRRALANNKLTSLRVSVVLEHVLATLAAMAGGSATSSQSESLLLLPLPRVLSRCQVEERRVRNVGGAAELRKFTAFGNPASSRQKLQIRRSQALVRSLDLSGITRKDREDIHLLGKRRGGER